MAAGCGPSPEQTEQPTARSSAVTKTAAFALHDITVTAGIDFVHQTSLNNDYHMPDIMGYGCGVFDFDRDGDLDLIFASNGSNQPGKSFDTNPTLPSSLAETPDPLPPDASNTPLDWPGTVFRQDTPGQFTRMSEPTKTPGNKADTSTAMGVAIGDVNNDGWPDIYITNYGNDQLFLNRAGTGFQNITAAAGISNPRWGTSACFIDYDRDGWLDLYVTNYVDYFPQECVQLSGVNPDFCGPQRFKATRDCLFRNTAGESPDGLVQFQDVTSVSGIGELSGKGLGVAAADFTDDGWQDIYVANDQEPNFLWVNQQDGTFREEAILLGCATDHLGNSQASMGVCVHDFDDNGLLDILVTHIDGERNTLYLGTEHGDFQDATLDWPICRQSLDQTGFGIALADLDSDGIEEVLVANGRVRRPDGAVTAPATSQSFWDPYRQSALAHSPSGASPISRHTGVFRSLIAEDIDNDGDSDILLTSVSGPPTLLQNDHPTSSQAVVLLVRATDANLGSRDALGATVTLKTNARTTSRIIQTCGSYLSAVVPVAKFSLAPTETVEELSVLWPDGLREKFPSPTLDRRPTEHRPENYRLELERRHGIPIQ
jgi:enediyne biosynthesis protein E4